MKYERLTKEQFEELHQEFINFLATQSITVEEWSDIKTNKPEVAEQELDVFSDLIWEGVLNSVRYLENISSSQMHLFCLDDQQMRLIAVKVLNPSIDLTTTKGFAWFKENFLTDQVEMMTASKRYSADKNKDRFDLIKKGAVITKGALFNWFDQLVNVD